MNYIYHPLNNVFVYNDKPVPDTSTKKSPTIDFFTKRGINTGGFSGIAAGYFGIHNGFFGVFDAGAVNGFKDKIVCSCAQGAENYFPLKDFQKQISPEKFSKEWWDQVPSGSIFKTSLRENSYTVHKNVMGRIFKENDEIFLCQDVCQGAPCSDKLGYKYSWCLYPGSSLDMKGYNAEDLEIISYNNELGSLFSKTIKKQNDGHIKKRNYTPQVCNPVATIKRGEGFTGNPIQGRRTKTSTCIGYLSNREINCI